MDSIFVRSIVAAALSLAASPAHAGLANCSSVYVGRYQVNAATGLTMVVLTEDPGSIQGSYWQFVPGTATDRIYQGMAAALLSAKLARTPILVATTATRGCSIDQGSYYLNLVELIS